jgi:hypothetical protein
MHYYAVLAQLILAAVLLRALIVKAQLLPPSCGRCGRHLERRELGEPVCSCGR